MAEAADRIEASRDLLRSELLAAATCAGFGNGTQALKELQERLRKVISERLD